MTREEAVVKLYELIDFYYENRDQPVRSNFDFFQGVENCCEILDLDYHEIKKKFNLDF